MLNIHQIYPYCLVEEIDKGSTIESKHDIAAMSVEEALGAWMSRQVKISPQAILQVAQTLLAADQRSVEEKSIDDAIVLCHQLKSRGNISVKLSSAVSVCAARNESVWVCASNNKSERGLSSIPLELDSTSDCIESAYMFVCTHPNSEVDFLVATRASQQPHQISFRWNGGQVQTDVQGENAAKVKAHIKSKIEFYI